MSTANSPKPGVRAVRRVVREAPELEPGQHFFSPCPRGLEPVLADELARLGAAGVKVVPGGVGYTGDWKLVYAVNLESRIATRVLWRVGQGPYRKEDDIYKLACGLPWERWFSPKRTLRVYTTAVRSPLKSVDFVTLRVKDAICDRMREQTRQRPSIDTASPDVRAHVFLTDREATLYLDTSGEPLYKRGFKVAAVEAPIKENLAAGIILLSGWDRVEPFFDPMCGSGTFLIEAAQMALDIAPGLGRSFAFEKLTPFSAAVWMTLRDAAAARAQPPRELPIFGSDISGRELARCKENLQAAKLPWVVRVEGADLLDRAPPADHGVMVTNPPYGVRLEDKPALDAFYPRLGDLLKQRYAGWRCHFITADPDFPKLIKLKASRRTPLFNGALECRLFEYRMVDGSLRTRRSDAPPDEQAG
ncbi:class I SAM-dependent RNA methyltransferase [Methyloversatilis sp.]|uniref:THUMP domain-containing class I SAM-dependent RNA methyltransferase n=1 Tax=Methyloversatilis sp. TaxID=2569862 RepID=UPI0035AFE13F